MYLGIEIGGTKLQIGVGPGDGTLAGLWRQSVDVAAGPEGIRQQITAGVPALLARSGVGRSQLRGVGIGFGGPVDDSTRTIIKSHQIEGWDGFPLADWITEITELPSVLANDADVAGLAEALFGAGKGLSPIFYITVGSGIGGGLIIHGEIHRGAGRGAAEIGHLRATVASGEKMGTGTGQWLESAAFLRGWPEPVPIFSRHVPLEEVSSGWAIQEKAREETRSDPARGAYLAQLAGGIECITAVDVARAAAEGDPLAGAVLSRALTYLAEGICQVIALICPRRIVIGGGVSLMGETLFFQPLRQLAAERVFKPFGNCYEIVPSALGEEVVVYGAVALARRTIAGWVK